MQHQSWREHIIFTFSFLVAPKNITTSTEVSQLKRMGSFVAPHSQESMPNFGTFPRIFEVPKMFWNFCVVFVLYLRSLSDSPTFFYSSNQWINFSQNICKREYYSHDTLILGVIYFVPSNFSRFPSNFESVICSFISQRVSSSNLAWKYKKFQKNLVAQV